MVEILYAQTTENPDPVFTEWTGRRMPKDTRVTVFKHHDKVCITNSVQICGLPKYGSDKRYYEWRTVCSFGFRMNGAGNVVAYDATRPPIPSKENRKGWKFRSPTLAFSALSYAADEPSEIFRHAVWQVFDIRKMEDIYPMAAEYGLRSYDLIPGDLRRAMRSDNWADYTTAVFGSKRSTPRLIAAVANTEPYVVSLARQFRGYVDDDRLTSYVENTQFDEELEEAFEPHQPRIRKLVKVMAPKTRESLTRGGIDLKDTRCIASLSHVMNYNASAVEDAHYVSWSELAPWVK